MNLVSNDGAETWSTNTQNTTDQTKSLLARLALKVRAEQLQIFLRTFKPGPSSSVLDVGVSPNESLPDTNFFEKNYPYPTSLVGASVENVDALKLKYPKIRFQQIPPFREFPFADGEFDLVTAWATLEHAGDRREQALFLQECQRVGKNFFLTVPYRACVYEPHAGFFFLHWLPLGVFRRICSWTGREFWAQERNLNPLYISDIREMAGDREVFVKVYRMFGWFPSHLLISSVPLEA